MMKQDKSSIFTYSEAWYKCHIVQLEKPFLKVQWITDDEFHINSLERVHIYIEKEIFENFSSNSIIDEFKNMKEQKTILYICVISLISFVVIIVQNYAFIFIVLVTIIKYIWVYILAPPNLLVKIHFTN